MSATRKKVGRLTTTDPHSHLTESSTIMTDLLTRRRTPDHTRNGRLSTVPDVATPPHTPNCPAWCTLSLEEPDPLRAPYGVTPHGGPTDEPLHSATIGKVTDGGETFGVLVEAIEDCAGGVSPPALWLSDGFGMRPMEGAELARYVPELVQAYADMLADLVSTGGPFEPVITVAERRAELHVLPDPPAVLPVPED